MTQSVPGTIDLTWLRYSHPHKMSPLISWSLLSTIREEEVIEGVHSLFCSLANNKTVSTLITVTTCKLLGGISAIRPFIAE